jgi:hypothetical protein
MMLPPYHSRPPYSVEQPAIAAPKSGVNTRVSFFRLGDLGGQSGFDWGEEGGATDEMSGMLGTYLFQAPMP